MNHNKSNLKTKLAGYRNISADYFIITIKSLTIFLITVLIFSGSSCDKKVSVSPVEPPNSNGKLIVISTPKGAKIFLDNKYTGFITPDTINWLDPRLYKIKLEKQDFLDVNASVTIKNDSLSSFEYNYFTDPSMRGSLVCSSYPTGALVTLNDSSTGKITPTTLNGLFPGNYNVKFSYYNHRDAEIPAIVKSGVQNQINAVLLDTSKWITFNTQNSGLETNLLNSVTIENGYIKWIGSVDGLIKYDDASFTLYNQDNSGLPDNGVFNVFVDNIGNKWICTFAGLAKFDNVSWTVYDVVNSNIPADEITSVTVDANNNVWVGTYNKGIGKFNGNSWQVYNASNSELPSNFISALTFDQSGNLWIGTMGSGIVKYSGSSWTNYTSQNSGLPPSNYVKDIKIKPDGTVWAAFSDLGRPKPRTIKIVNRRNPVSIQAGSGGTAYFDGISWTKFTQPSKNSTSISFGLYGLIWIGTSGNGFASYDGAVFKYFRSNTYPIPSDNTICIAVDYNGNKWVVTSDAGLIKYKGD